MGAKGVTLAILIIILSSLSYADTDCRPCDIGFEEGTCDCSTTDWKTADKTEVANWIEKNGPNEIVPKIALAQNADAGTVEALKTYYKNKDGKGIPADFFIDLQKHGNINAIGDPTLHPNLPASVVENLGAENQEMLDKIVETCNEEEEFIEAENGNTCSQGSTTASSDGNFDITACAFSDSGSSWGACGGIKSVIDNEAKGEAISKDSGTNVVFQTVDNQADYRQDTLHTGSTTIRLDTFSSSDSIQVSGDSFVTINNNIFLSSAVNVRREGDQILIDRAASAEKTFTLSYGNITQKFENAKNLSFKDKETKIDFVQSMLFTKATKTGKTTYIITSAKGVDFSEDELSIAHADSIIMGDNFLASNAYDVKIPFIYQNKVLDLLITMDEFEDIRMGRTDSVIIGKRPYLDLKKAHFITSNKTLKFANITSNQNNTYQFFNLLEPTIDIEVELKTDETLEYLYHNQSMLLKSNDPVTATLANHELKLHGTNTILDKDYSEITILPTSPLTVYYGAQLIKTNNLNAYKKWKSFLRTDDKLLNIRSDKLNSILEGTNLTFKSENNKIKVVKNNEQYKLIALYNLYTRPTIHNLTHHPLDLELQSDLIKIKHNGMTASFSGISANINQNLKASLLIQTPTQNLTTLEAFELAKNNNMLLPPGSKVTVFQENHEYFNHPITIYENNNKIHLAKTDAHQINQTASALLVKNSTIQDFTVFNSQLTLVNNATEIIKSTKLTTGTLKQDLGIHCTNLGEKATYTYEHDNKINSFQIKANDFYRLCLKKQKLEQHATDCQNCGLFDLTTYKAELKDDVKYLRYPYINTNILLSTLKLTLSQNKSTTSQLMFKNEMRDIHQLSIYSEETKHLSTTKTPFNYYTIEETPIKSKLHRIIFIDTTKQADNPINVYKSPEQSNIEFQNKKAFIANDNKITLIPIEDEQAQDILTMD